MEQKKSTTKLLVAIIARNVKLDDLIEALARKEALVYNFERPQTTIPKPPYMSFNQSYQVRNWHNQ